MKLYEILRTLSRGKQIALAVFALHCLAVVALLGHHLYSRKMRPTRPMIVRTVPPSIPAIAPKSPPTQQIEKKITQSLPKKAAPATDKKPPLVKPTKAKAPPSVAPAQQELLQEIAQSLDTVSKPTPTPRTQLTIPTKITPTAQTQTDSYNPSYDEQLIAFLQDALILPEYGTVRAKLEIDSSGKLLSCTILETRSAKNAAFLKNRLPELSFPCLNGVRSCIVTFCNVEVPANTNRKQ